MKYLVLCVTLNLLFFINTVYSTVTISAKYDDDSTKSVNFLVRHPFQLICTVSSDDKVDVKWEKEEVPIANIERMKGRTRTSKKDTTYTLKVHHTVDEDAGNYSCVAYEDGKRETAATIIVTSQIAVKVPSNINVVEGENLRIQCNVVGKPVPKLYWFYNNDTYNDTYYQSSGRVTLEDDTEKNIARAILKLSDVQMFDRGTFTCIGKSEISDETVSSECMIRVKDKYAALWPFLGICAEVFILCAIIFIYEKKRNKTELEESDTDQSPDQKNTPDHGKDANLRHRQ